MHGSSASSIGATESCIGECAGSLGGRGALNLLAWLLAGGPRAAFQREGNLP